MWEWANAIVDSFSHVAYYELVRTGLMKYLPKDIEEEFYNSYNMIEGIKHMVKEAKTAHSFYYGYCGSEEQVNVLFANVKTYSNTVKEHLTFATDEIYEFDIQE